VCVEAAPTGTAVPAGFASRVHLLALADGAPLRAPLEAAPPWFSPAWSYTLQIAGDLLGVLYELPRVGMDVLGMPYLAVWDWRSGVQLMSLAAPDVASFAFIDERHVLVGREPPDGVEPPSLDILVLGGDPLTRACTLAYPALAPGCVAGDLLIRTDPAVGWAPPRAARAPFHVAGDERVLLVTFRVDSPTLPHPRPIVHCVPRRALLAAIATHSGGAQVSWAAWAPAHTRLWADEVLSDTWVCYVFGARWVSARVRRTGAGVARLRVWLRDFSGAGVRATRALEPGEGRWRLRADESALEADEEIFADRVATAAPYRETWRWLPREVYSGGRTSVMLAEDALVLVEEPVRVAAHLRVDTPLIPCVAAELLRGRGCAAEHARPRLLTSQPGVWGAFRGARRRRRRYMRAGLSRAPSVLVAARSVACSDICPACALHHASRCTWAGDTRRAWAPLSRGGMIRPWAADTGGAFGKVSVCRTFSMRARSGAGEGARRSRWGESRAARVGSTHALHVACSHICI
jgi:hypothetical protein